MRPDQKITAAIYDRKHAWFFLTYITDTQFVFLQKVLYANLIRTLINGLLYVLQFSATLLTQHLLNQKLASTP